MFYGCFFPASYSRLSQFSAAVMECRESKPHIWLNLIMVELDAAQVAYFCPNLTQSREKSSPAQPVIRQLFCFLFLKKKKKKTELTLT